jgi:hypothetical protein
MRRNRLDKAETTYWDNKVLNLEALGPAERKLWHKLTALINDVLDELKMNGKIETVYTTSEMNSLRNVLDKLNKITLARNALIHLFEDPNPKPFYDDALKFGISEENIVYQYIATEIMTEVLSTELFKLLFLFHLKNVDFAVSKFSSTMKNAAPKCWSKLAPFVDSDFRNALSHGTYSVTTRNVVLFKDAKVFEPVDEGNMSFAEFMIRIKVQNVLYHSLIDALVQKKKSGFFMP